MSDLLIAWWAPCSQALLMWLCCVYAPLCIYVACCVYGLHTLLFYSVVRQSDYMKTTNMYGGILPTWLGYQGKIVPSSYLWPIHSNLDVLEVCLYMVPWSRAFGDIWCPLALRSNMSVRTQLPPWTRATVTGAFPKQTHLRCAHPDQLTWADQTLSLPEKLSSFFEVYVGPSL